MGKKLSVGTLQIWLRTSHRGLSDYGGGDKIGRRYLDSYELHSLSYLQILHICTLTGRLYWLFQIKRHSRPVTELKSPNERQILPLFILIQISKQSDLHRVVYRVSSERICRHPHSKGFCLISVCRKDFPPAARVLRCHLEAVTSSLSIKSDVGCVL